MRKTIKLSIEYLASDPTRIRIVWQLHRDQYARAFTSFDIGARRIILDGDRVRGGSWMFPDVHRHIELSRSACDIHFHIRLGELIY